MDTTDTDKSAPKKGRVATNVTSLDTLVGAHPDALATIFSKGQAARPESLGDRPRGRLLTFVSTREVHLALRPAIEWLSKSVIPWDGIVFDHGGNAGANVFMGKEVMRFRAESAKSALDGEPALVLTYGSNPWPMKLLRDELRIVNDGLAIGPTFVELRGTPHLIAWFGLEASH